MTPPYKPTRRSMLQVGAWALGAALVPVRTPLAVAALPPAIAALLIALGATITGGITVEAIRKWFFEERGLDLSAPVLHTAEGWSVTLKIRDESEKRCSGLFEAAWQKETTFFVAWDDSLRSKGREHLAEGITFDLCQAGRVTPLAEKLGFGSHVSIESGLKDLYLRERDVSAAHILEVEANATLYLKEGAFGNGPIAVPGNIDWNDVERSIRATERKLRDLIDQARREARVG